MIVSGMKQDKTISLFERFGPMIGARSEAAALRNEILENISQDIVTKLNFESVRTLNSSFSDELIAKLVEEIGIEVFSRMVKLSNANSEAKSIVNFVVNSRLKKQA